jgi:hypothetical protein
MTTLELDDPEKAALIELLPGTIDRDRYPLVAADQSAGRHSRPGNTDCHRVVGRPLAVLASECRGFPDELPAKIWRNPGPAASIIDGRNPGNMVRSKALEATAYHEAGHAVVAWDQHVGLRRISIVPDRGSAGRVHHAPIWGRYNPEWDASPQVRLRGERLIRVSLAGMIAQRRFNPRTVRHYHGAEDHAKAVDMIFRLAASDEHADAYMKLLEIETRIIVHQRWELIGAFAAELMIRRLMIGAEANHFIRTWFAAQSAERP